MNTIRNDGSPSPAPANTFTLQVLIVDDDADYRDSMTLLLRCLGHGVQTAPDGPAALMMVQEHPPDVVLLDISMPEMNGYDLARRLRAVAHPMRPLLVAVTGYASQGDRVLSEEAGIDLHLAKPVPPAVLSHVLARFLRVLDPASAEVV
jgi:CheY-like chemotaxis protein